MLIVFAGPPCSGKTTLAAELARRHGWPHMSMDATRQRLLPDAPHTRADRIVAMHGMHLAAEMLLSVGATAVLDAPYQQPEDRAELLRVAGACWKLIECRVSPEAAARRLIDRGWPDPTRPDLTEEKVARLAREYPYQSTGLVLDTVTLDFAACMQRIEAFLDADQAETPTPRRGRSVRT